MTNVDYSAGERLALLPWASAPVPTPPSPLFSAPSASGAILRTRDCVRGMLMGVAIGDALGNTSESMTPALRRETYGLRYGGAQGDIRDYLPNPRDEMRAVGLPGDDSQLTFWTLESLLRRGYLDPVAVADAFTRRERIYGIGATITAFLLSYRLDNREWFEAGRPSAGNGALMRISPVLLPHLRAPTGALWRDVVAATILTHRDEAAVAASVGFVGLLMECLAWSAGNWASDVPGDGAPPKAGIVGGTVAAPPPRWWPETFLRYARAVETGAAYDSLVAGDSFHGSLCDRVEQTVFPAIDAEMSVVEAAERWRSGAYLIETVPCVLQVLALHSGDPEEAIVRAVNDTWDNDTIASVVGATVGALHGEEALPMRWRECLLGRTREADDGHVQGLIERAVGAFAS
ncbi:MAG: ADP-ribosylglycohydrolase family protein [Thermoleophilia bacterium]|nr:ADP-ribosylglycohydrolase family protein [Thermoleophilia bacterium]